MKILSSLFSGSVLAVSLLAAAHASTNSFIVDARENSTATDSHDAAPLDTNIALRIGDILNITASGSWNGGYGCADNGPGGTPCIVDPNTGINYFALVGRIGDGDYFEIGDSYSGVANSRGDLFLGFLDVNSSDNRGNVTAVVQLTAVPEPETCAMLLAGLGLTGFLARRRSAFVPRHAKA